MAAWAASAKRGYVLREVSATVRRGRWVVLGGGCVIHVSLGHEPPVMYSASRDTTAYLHIYTESDKAMYESLACLACGERARLQPRGGPAKTRRHCPIGKLLLVRGPETSHATVR